VKKSNIALITILNLILLATVLSSPAHSDVRNTRGELIFSDDKIEAVRTDPAYQQLRNVLIAEADYIERKIGHPVDVLDIYTNYRYYEDYIIRLVMAYLITDDKRYFDKTVEYLDKMSSYESWDYWCGNDLLTSHFIMGLSFAYDYLYDELDPTLREKVRQRLLKEMDEKFYGAHRSWFFDANITNRSSLLGNHLWISNVAIYQAAVALRDEIPADLKAEYIGTTTEMIVEKVIPLLPKDGTGQEGTAYSLYGLRNLLKFMEIKKMNEGINLYSNSEYFKHIMYYMQHMMFPDHKLWVNTGDHPNNALWGPPHLYAYRLAAEFNDPVIQHFVASYQIAGSYPAFSLFWYDADLRPQIPAGGIPKIAFFKTSGEVAYRASWDSDTLYVNFICGEYKTGHAHPDQNQFIIYHKGNHLLTDHGYSYWKNTQEHNTLLIDGYGQIGENYIWLPGDDCSGLSDTYDFFKDESSQYVHFTGDATRSYRPQAELELYRRHFSILGNYIFVVDDVKTRTPKSMEIRFHNADLSTTVDRANRFTITEPQKKAKLTVQDSQITFHLDETKYTDIAPTYYVPTDGYPGLAIDELHAYLKDYYNTEKPYETDKRVSEVFDDFTADGHPPPQHGSHLSQKTKENATHAVFKNLLIVGDTGDSGPIVTNIKTDTLTGYEIESADKKILYLFNTTDDMQRVNIYENVSFRGLMITAVFDHVTGAETFYTKQATIIPSIFLLGDVTGNGEVSSYDASLAAQHSIGLVSLAPGAVEAADVTKNSEVSSYDASLIAQYAIGLIERF